jgi:diguanylate cyclase (GGDEF)-like protein
MKNAIGFPVMRPIVKKIIIPKAKLRSLVFVLAISAVLATLINSSITSYVFQREQIIQRELGSHKAYAQKLASSMELYTHSARLQLKYSSFLVARNFTNKNFLRKEVERIRLQDNIFNSVLIISATGEILASSPNPGELEGRFTATVGPLTALYKRSFYISHPYKTPRGSLSIFLANPIIGDDGKYQGYVGGTVSLKGSSSFNMLLDDHYYTDGSYTYVVDHEGKIIFHPDHSRIGNSISENPAVKAIARGESGSMQLTNSSGVAVLAGYAHLNEVQWGFVSQIPLDDALSELNSVSINVFMSSIPIICGLIILVWCFVKVICKPLDALTACAHDMDHPQTPGRVRAVRAWYYEASELKRGMRVGIGFLHNKIGALSKDAQTDALTGLHNRRGFTMATEDWEEEGRPFSVIALDIDHFKNVNDTFGHDVGDMVIKQIAILMQSLSRENDILCRVGGEEFIMLLPNTSTDAAAKVAERLRVKVETTHFQGPGRVTISQGVSHWPKNGRQIDDVMKVADQMLYQAKKEGRNTVRVADPSRTAHSY